MIESQHRLKKQWNALHFGEVKVETSGGQHVFEVQVFLNDLSPQAARVELYADRFRDKAPVRREMKLTAGQPGPHGSHIYSATVSADRPSGDYTARMVPRREGVAIPLEDARIIWQR